MMTVLGLLVFFFFFFFLQFGIRHPSILCPFTVIRFIYRYPNFDV